MQRQAVWWAGCLPLVGRSGTCFHADRKAHPGAQNGVSLAPQRQCDGPATPAKPANVLNGQLV